MSKKMTKMAIIGSVGVPAKYGGFETLVHFLVDYLNKDFDLTVYCSEYNYPIEERVRKWNGAKLHYIPLQANGLQSILYDFWSMLHAIRHSEVLLVLGVSGCIFLPFIKLISKKKIIVNIDGLEWRRAKWNWVAKKFLKISEQVACRFADEVVTDNRILKEYVKIRYSIKGNLIEYGADHTIEVPITPDDLRAYPFLGRPYAFKVARIEPENNIHIILNAFSKIKDQIIVVVGNWNNSLYGRSLKKQYESFPNIHLLDPIYEPKRLNLLRSNAKYYVHGHSAGGTNPSLVEAMYLSLPVVAFDVIYNRVTTNNQAIFFHDEKSLKQVIQSIDKYPLIAIAKTLKAFANRRYTWENVANRYAQIAIGKEQVEIPVIAPTSAVEELATQALQQPQIKLPQIKNTEVKKKEDSFIRA